MDSEDLSDVDPPAKNTRRQKLSASNEKKKMADPVHVQLSVTNAFTPVTTSYLSKVNNLKRITTTAIDKCELNCEEDYTDKVLHSFANADKGSQASIAHQRQSVGEIVNRLESLSPASTPVQTPVKGHSVYKKGTKRSMSEGNKPEENMTTVIMSVHSVRREEDIVNDYTTGDYAEWIKSQQNWGDDDTASQNSDFTQPRSPRRENWESPTPQIEKRSGATGYDASSDSEYSEEEESETEITISKKKDLENEDKLINSYKARLQQNDSTVIFEMFELMIEKMNQVQIRLDSLEKSNFQLKKATRSNSKNVSTQAKDMENVGEAMINLVQCAVKVEQDVELIEEKLERVESNMNKGSIRITGITESQGENVREKVSSFWKNKLGITQEITIQTAYRIGKGKNRPILVRLLDPNDAQVIFANTSKLKDAVDENNVPFFVREQLTEKQLEDKKRRREIITSNKKLPVSHQQNITVKGDDLFIGPEKYKKRVPPPKAKTILMADNLEKANYRAYRLQPSKQVEKDGSKFMAYAMQTKNFEEIREACKQVKEEHLSARHILCGYRLIGGNIPVLQGLL